MERKISWPGFILGVLAAVVLLPGGILPVLADQRAPAGAVVLPADGPTSLFIPAATFSSDGGFPDGFFFDFEDGYIEGAEFGCLKAPAYLPDRARVTAVTGYLYDNNFDQDITLNLRRVNLDSGGQDIMAEVKTYRPSTGILERVDSSIDYPLVQYPDYAYYLTICLSTAEQRLYAVNIDYEPGGQLYLPVVLNNF